MKTAFDEFRALVADRDPDRLARLDALAHKMSANHDDDLFALIEFQSLAGLETARELAQLHDEAAQAHKAALDSHAGQLSREIAELRKDLAQTREAPKFVAESVAQLQVETSGLEKAASLLAAYTIERIQAEIQRAEFRWGLFGFAIAAAGMTGIKWLFYRQLF